MSFLQHVSSAKCIIDTFESGCLSVTSLFNFNSRISKIVEDLRSCAFHKTIVQKTVVVGKCKDVVEIRCHPQQDNLLQIHPFSSTASLSHLKSS